MVKIKHFLIPLMLAFVLFFGSKVVHAYYQIEDVFFGSFHYEQQMTDFYSLYPEVKYHDGLPFIWEESGKYYFGGDISYLVMNMEDYYGDVKAIFGLNYSGWSAYEGGDEYTIVVGSNAYNLPLGSQLVLYLDTIEIINNGESFGYWKVLSLMNIGSTFQKNYGYNPDYYVGYDEGYNTGYDNGLNYGHFLHNNDYQLGVEAGYGFGYNDGYSVGFTDGFESTDDGGMWGVLWSAILAPFMILNTEMLPGITLAMIVAVPLVFGLLGWILSTGKSRK